jgi:hypothetical protein
MGSTEGVFATPYSDIAEIRSQNRYLAAVSAVPFISVPRVDEARGIRAPVQNLMPRESHFSTMAVSGKIWLQKAWDRKFTPLLPTTALDGQLDKAFTSVAARIITPSVVKDGILPANLFGLREIVRLMSSANAKLHVLDYKMARFNRVKQTGLTMPGPGQGLSQADESLRSAPRSIVGQAGTLSNPFKTVKLFIAGNLLTFIPVSLLFMTFVFFLFRRIEKTT